MSEPDVLAQAKATLEAAGYKVQQRKPSSRKRREIETLTDDEIRSLFAEANPTRWEGQRDRAIMALLLATGLRIGEALSLEPDDLRIEGDIACVSVPCVEGCKTGARVVPLRWLEDGNPTQVAVELSAWIVQRPESEYLFCTRVGNRLHRNGFNRSLQTYARRAGIEKRMHSHLFRHTYATRRVSEGWTQADVQRALGHSSANTTSIYIEANIDRLKDLVLR